MPILKDQVSLPEPPVWLRASADDFATIEINEPVAAAATMDCLEASTLFGTSAKLSAESQNGAEERVYSMLGAICSFHFKPNEPAEPFGPMMRMGESRSAQPDDFKGTPATLLAAQYQRATHLGLRSRMADLVWLLDRRQWTAAIVAIAAYVDIVRAIINRTGSLRSNNSDEHDDEIPGYLRRALQIGKAVGWNKDIVRIARELVSALRSAAAVTDNVFSFLRYAHLDLDYTISEPAMVANEAEKLSVATDDLDGKHRLLHCAARAYRLAKKQADADRCLLHAAESLVAIADRNTAQAMLETHWLEQAIAELHHVPNSKELRRQLKHRLIDAQSRIIGELSQFSHSTNITEVVESAKKLATGQSLSAAMRALATVSQAPAPDRLADEARKSIAEHPLASLFNSTTYDDHGKPVHRSPGGGLAGENDAAIKRQIAMSEKIRRSLASQGLIEPIRQAILLEHHLDSTPVEIIFRYSPFIPADRVAIFANGILHFLQGDAIAAVHILLPQLENSLRHILRLNGHDVMKINADDMTQEEFGLPALTNFLHSELEAIFGVAMIADIESLCIYRGGPQLRDRLAHGLIPDWEPFGPDAVYACWLIYQLCCIPLLPHWDDLEVALNS